jgi:hypothetical protein
MIQPASGPGGERAVGPSTVPGRHAIVAPWRSITEAKHRDQKQKDAAKAVSATQAKSKQDSYGRPAGSPLVKGKK